MSYFDKLQCNNEKKLYDYLPNRNLDDAYNYDYMNSLMLRIYRLDDVQYKCMLLLIIFRSLIIKNIRINISRFSIFFICTKLL